jgi:membrane associated rhomboid family serine protease
MLPLNDTESNRYTLLPYMTIAIVLINAVVTGFEYRFWRTDPSLLREVIYLYGSNPYLVNAGMGGGALSSLASMFLHGDIVHLLGNMLALWVFGRRVEDVCGPWRFLMFYITCGVFADVISSIIHAGTDIPSIGASGAIFGVMGAYLLLFPEGRIRTFVPIFFIPTFPKIRAFWIVLYFLAVQIIPALNVLFRKEDYHINYWAHLGGFIACFSIFLFLRPEAVQRYFSKLPV